MKSTGTRTAALLDLHPSHNSGEDSYLSSMESRPAMSSRSAAGKRFLRLPALTAAASLAAVGVALTPGTAHAAVGQRWDVINISYYDDYANPGGPVASCRNDGSTCTLTVTQSVSTTIQTSLGMSQSGVAAGVSFQLNRTVSSAASCTSPQLAAGHKFVAYRLGRQAMYKIKHTVASQNKVTVDTSGWLFSWEPYNGAHIECYTV